MPSDVCYLGRDLRGRIQPVKPKVAEGVGRSKIPTCNPEQQRALKIRPDL